MSLTEKISDILHHKHDQASVLKKALISGLYWLVMNSKASERVIIDLNGEKYLRLYDDCQDMTSLYDKKGNLVKDYGGPAPYINQLPFNIKNKDLGIDEDLLMIRKEKDDKKTIYITKEGVVLTVQGDPFYSELSEYYLMRMRGLHPLGLWEKYRETYKWLNGKLAGSDHDERRAVLLTVDTAVDNYIKNNKGKPDVQKEEIDRFLTELKRYVDSNMEKFLKDMGAKLR